MSAKGRGGAMQTARERRGVRGVHVRLDREDEKAVLAAWNGLADAHEAPSDPSPEQPTRPSET